MLSTDCKGNSDIQPFPYGLRSRKPNSTLHPALVPSIQQADLQFSLFVLWPKVTPLIYQILLFRAISIAVLEAQVGDQTRVVHIQQVHQGHIKAFS